MVTLLVVDRRLKRLQIIKFFFNLRISEIIFNQQFFNRVFLRPMIYVSKLFKTNYKEKFILRIILNTLIILIYIAMVN